MRHPGPGIPLYADGELAVYERRVVGADGRHWTITALTRATVEQSVGPALHFYGGWALSTAGFDLHQVWLKNLVQSGLLGGPMQWGGGYG